MLKVKIVLKSKQSAASVNAVTVDSEVCFNLPTSGSNRLDCNYLDEYGSDDESCASQDNRMSTNIDIRKGVDNGGNHTEETAEEKQDRAEMEKLLENEEAPLSVKHWKLMLQQMKDTFRSQVHEETKNLRTSVKNVEDKQVTHETEMSKIQSQLKVCQVQLKEVIGVTIRQDQIIQECKDHIEELTQKVNRCNLMISGLDAYEGESCVEVVKSFFSSKLGIQQEIAIKEAFRVGKNKTVNRPMIVQLQNPRDKGIIFKNTKKLRGVKNGSNESYFVSDQLSGKKRAERQRVRQLMAVNRGLENTPLHLNMKTECGELMVEGERYVKQLRAPSCREILKASREQRMARLDKEVSVSHHKTFNGQVLIGYTASVKTIDEANTTLAKIRGLHTDARHVICACRIPGKNFHMCQDYVDDNEHGGGSYLLNLLVNSEIQNRILIVVRSYDGQHIGEKRYQLMWEAAKSAVDHAPINEVTGKNNCIWETSGGCS